MRGRNRPDARWGGGLIELVEVRGARLHRIERAAQDPHNEIESAVAVQVAGRGRVVAARLERRSRWKWNPIAVEIGMTARPLVANPQQTRLEEIAPENVGIAIAIDVEHRHRIGAVQRRLALADDLDVFEPFRDKPEPRGAQAVEALHLIASDRAVHAAQQHVELAVAIDVGELGDVLSIGVDRDALHILQRVGGDHEARRRARPDVAVITDVAERRLREEIVESVAVHVHEAVPLPDVDSLEPISRQPPAVSRALEELELTRVLLNEEIDDTVAIDVEELGARVLEAS